MSDAYDAIVIGAGHNGLVAGAALARRGHRVVILEKRGVTGGLCAREEFHPGYFASGLLHDTATLRRGVIDVLRLNEYGLDLNGQPERIFSPARADAGSDRGLIISTNADETAAGLASVSAHDAGAYVRWRAFVKRVRGVVEPMLCEEPPDLSDFSMSNLMGLAQRGLAARRLGASVLMGLIRIPPMCVADWLREYFETEALNALLTGPAILGTWCGPWSPGTAANLLIRECTAGSPVVGGAGALAESLLRAARHFGAQVRTDASVTRVRVSNGRVEGVDLKGGESIDARVVLSSVDPKTTMLTLLDAADVPQQAVHQAEVFRARGTTACVRLALDGRIVFSCRPDAREAHVRTGADLDTLERAFDAVKYRRMSEGPWLDIYIASVEDESAAPAGCDSVSVLASFVPRDLDGGWTDAAREHLANAVTAELERFAPGLSRRVIGREVLSPADIESRYGTWGGHIHHGEHALDQLVVRPFPAAGHYATPVEGLYLAGSGSFPGGGVSGAPGLLGAMTAMRTL